MLLIPSLARSSYLQALNGPGKAWKNEPVHKSPLYVYVIPLYFDTLTG
jgi:hypothetical protein